MPNDPRIGSLCTGYGGLAVPAERGVRATPDADRGGHGKRQDTRTVGGVEGGDAGPSREREWTRGFTDTGSLIDWGKYARAIESWSSLTRLPPDPTIVDAKGRRRLAPRFVEWMMGLRDGHVTGHGLSGPAELKALGNGVVPQQAELALRMLGVGSAGVALGRAA